MAGTLAIEIADAALLAFSRVATGGRHHGSSPGYAFAEGQALLVGQAAAARAHLKPRQVCTRFWESLEPEPVGKPFPAATTHSDLAHAHLRALWEPCRAFREVVLAVPGFRTERQLGLILGLARSLEMPVVGLVDSAVAVAQGQPGPACVHLDLHLHRASATAVRRRGVELVRERVETVEGAGLLALQEAWARAVEQAFLAQARFDPRHAGESEQALHEALPGWLATLEHADRVTLRLRAGTREHEAVLERAAALAAAESVCRQLVQLVGLLRQAGEPTTILLSARAAAVPSLAARLRQMPGAEVVTLLPEAVAAGALVARAQAEPVDGDAVPLLVRLHAAEPPAAATRPGPAGDGAPAATLPGLAAALPGRPSHLLLGVTLHRLAADALVLGTAPPAGSRGVTLSGETVGISRAHCRAWVDGELAFVEDQSSYGTFVNDQRVSARTRLHPGDRLRLGTPGIELVVVAEAGS